MDVNESEKIIATCRDTMLTALEKVGGQSLICSWTRHDGSTVKLSLTIRESDQNTVADCIRDMDGGQSEDDVRDWLELPESFLRH